MEFVLPNHFGMAPPLPRMTAQPQCSNLQQSLESTHLTTKKKKKKEKMDLTKESPGNN